MSERMSEKRWAEIRKILYEEPVMPCNDSPAVRAIGEIAGELEQALKAEREKVNDQERVLEKYRNGYQGACWACEPVGEKNVDLEAAMQRVEALPESLSRMRFVQETSDVRAHMAPDDTGEWVSWGMVAHKIKKAMKGEGHE